MEQAALIAAAIAVSMVLARVIEKLIDRRAGPTKPVQVAMSQQEHDWLRQLYSMHAQYDDDGVPKWYVPRRWALVQDDIVTTLREISQLQKDTVRILEAIQTDRNPR